MKHIKNRKTIGVIVIGAAILSVGSVGFASWVISGGDTETVSSLGVQVATIQNEQITISTPKYTNVCGCGKTENDSSKTLVDSTSDPKTAYVVFGPKSSDNTGLIQAGFTGDGEINDVEHLSVQFQFTLTSTNLNARLNELTITPTYPQVLTDLATSNYITNPSANSGNKVTLYTSTGTDYSTEKSGTTKSGTLSNGYDWNISAIDSSNTSVTVTITVNWMWGSTFGNDNPANNDADQTAVNAAIEGINAMNNAVAAATDKNVSFLIEVTSK